MKLFSLKNLLACLMILLTGCANVTPQYSADYKPSLETVVNLDEHLNSVQQLLQDVQNTQSEIEKSLNDVQSN